MLSKSIAFIGQAYYNAWVLRTVLPGKGWYTTLLDIDPNIENSNFYHGADTHLFVPDQEDKSLLVWQIEVFLNLLPAYEIFHFSNMNGIYFFNYNSSREIKERPGLLARMTVKVFERIFLSIFGSDIHRVYRGVARLGLIKIQNGRYVLSRLGRFLFPKLFNFLSDELQAHWEIWFLKYLGKKITYAHNGCLDGVSQTAFSKWGEFNTCSICSWRDRPEVCSDERNLEWGKFRNSITDLQFTVGGNRADYNLDPKVIELPEFYCLDEKLWSPDKLIPANYRLAIPEGTFKVYHSVGNFDSRTGKQNVNIKCTHIYQKVIEELKEEGYKIELIFIKGVSNKEIPYYIQQADVVADMLTFGFFGANVREALMMGKPSVCYISPEWKEQMREQRPEYASDLPIVSATPDTVKSVLVKLMTDKEYYGKCSDDSRAFALKYHSSTAGANKVNDVLTRYFLEN